MGTHEDHHRDFRPSLNPACRRRVRARCARWSRKVCAWWRRTAAPKDPFAGTSFKGRACNRRWPAPAGTCARWPTRTTADDRRSTCWFTPNAKTRPSSASRRSRRLAAIATWAIPGPACTSFAIVTHPRSIADARGARLDQIDAWLESPRRCRWPKPNPTGPSCAPGRRGLTGAQVHDARIAALPQHGVQTMVGRPRLRPSKLSVANPDRLNRPCNKPKTSPKLEPMPTPEEIHARVPLSEAAAESLAGRRAGKDSRRPDQRVFVVVGPRSIHDPVAGLITRDA